MITNAIVILLLPLSAFIIQIFFGKRLPRQGDWLPTGAIWLAFFFAVPLAWQVFSLHDPNFKLTWAFDWVKIGPLDIRMGLYLDNLAVIMVTMVTLVSALIHLFSVGYMEGDPRYSRFFAYLALFSFSMLGLVMADNFLAIYVFWELVGLCSYLLIGFWFERDSASNAAKKAFITTRVGDVGMFIGILILFTQLGSFNFEEVFTGVANGQLVGGLLTAAGILLFCGAVGKSAQVPLQVWLPDAMEGPTPVSALIHAATMVAAGVYLVGRTYVLYTSEALAVIAVIGTITAFLAATIAIVQVDIKRVLAYSTISQLGYMMAALGVGGFVAGLFHLLMHAFFKSLLFLGSGSIIHAMHHEQDMRQMGGLRRKMPITTYTFLAGTLAISGVPFFSGFYSKDAILASALDSALTTGSRLSMAVFVVLLLAAGITAFYMFRAFYLTFAGEPRNLEKYEHVHESPWVMTVPLIILGFFAVAGGYGGWFEKLVHVPSLAAYASAGGGEAIAEGVEAGGAHSIAMVLSITIAGLGILLATMIYLWKQISAEAWRQRFSGLYTLLWHKYYFDEIYGTVVVGGTLLFSRVMAWFDLYVIDRIVNGAAYLTKVTAFSEGRFDLRVVDGLVNAVARLVGYLGVQLRGIQTGRVQTYILTALAAVVLIYLIQWF